MSYPILIMVTGDIRDRIDATTVLEVKLDQKTTVAIRIDQEALRMDVIKGQAGISATPTTVTIKP